MNTTVINPAETSNTPKYLGALSAIYTAALISSIATVYELSSFFNITVSSSLFIFPITYMIGDIVAEIYGYKAAKKMIWLAMLSEVLFVGLVNLTIAINFGHNSQQIHYVRYGHLLFQAALANLIPMFLSEFLNAYILSRSKLLLHGKLFWFRSFSSTAISSAIYIIIAAVIAFGGDLTSGKLMLLIVASYLFKLFSAAVLGLIGNFIVKILMLTEKIKSTDKLIKFNPFSTS